jgi:hypothetical protein
MLAIKKGMEMEDKTICIYCGKDPGAYICRTCNEYDGIVTYADAAKYMPEEFGHLVS